MSHAQVMAAKIVIGKSITDLKSIQYSGNDEKPVQRHMIVEFVEPKRLESDTSSLGLELRFSSDMGRSN